MSGRYDRAAIAEEGEPYMSRQTLSVREASMSTASGEPLISVIIPVRNAALYLKRCLAGLADSSFTDFEVVVVDDGSTDSTRSIAQRFGVVLLSMGKSSGPAAARNVGAKKARGEILLFVDADVVLHSDTLELVAGAFRRDPQLAALFGSYDDKPAWNNLISQYKNLMHHYIHQISNSNATTFWTGLGAIRKSVFIGMGGFDEKRYRRPSIEDIELGYRLRRANHKIVLEKRLQGKHLKKWTLLSLLDADILCRAIPWAKLILETKTLPKDLNLQQTHRVSAFLVGLLVLMPSVFLLPPHTFGMLGGWLLFPLGVLVLLVTLLLLNRHEYEFFLQRKGWAFTSVAVGLHFLYYFYSGVVFVLCWIVFQARVWTHAFLLATRMRGGAPAER